MSDESNPVVSASELRRAILQKELDEINKAETFKAVQEKQLHEFAESFLRDQVSEDERAMIRKLVMSAVNNGKFEAMVYTFPSELCTDSGRAINNREAGWPNTLQGKAKELYNRYLEVAKPQGFRLKATIINFPDGMPGDVGLFLNWAPEQV